MAKGMCSIEGCDRSVRARDLCRGHYYRLEKYGDPLGAPAPRPTACTIEGCGKPIAGRGWCAMHWRRWRIHGDPLVTAWNQPKPGCSVEGCSDTACVRGYCNKHYLRLRRHGDPLTQLGPSPGGFTNKTCQEERCEKPTKALGWCAMHYRRWELYGSTELPERPKAPVALCSITDCGKPVECRGLCNKHYVRWRIHGDPEVNLISEITDTCSQKGCERRLAKAGLCWKHYWHFKAKFMAEQKGKCKLCGVPETDAPRGILLLDHDHATGQPRALLCHLCNCGLGMFRDSPELLALAIRYLEDMKPGQLALFTA